MLPQGLSIGALIVRRFWENYTTTNETLRNIIGHRLLLRLLYYPFHTFVESQLYSLRSQRWALKGELAKP